MERYGKIGRIGEIPHGRIRPDWGLTLCNPVIVVKGKWNSGQADKISLIVIKANGMLYGTVNFGEISVHTSVFVPDFRWICRRLRMPFLMFTLQAGSFSAEYTWRNSVPSSWARTTYRVRVLTSVL